jgi:LAS superfamily LD-carboxypeptidase LdcB
MQRRSFIKKSSATGLAMAMVPSLILPQEEGFSTEELMGKSDIQLYGKGINLKKEAHDAFVEMKKAAYGDGVDLKIVSSYRSFDRQVGIWERKYLQYTETDGLQPMEAMEKIIEYSTIPGTSRHHWGTEIDVVDGYQKVSEDVLDPDKFGPEAPYGIFKKWMDENANKFGFFLVYTDSTRRKGFKYEPWHYSYAALSIPMLTAFRKKNIPKLLQQEDFLGLEHFTAGFVRTYIQDNILDINPKLL